MCSSRFHVDKCDKSNGINTLLKKPARKTRQRTRPQMRFWTDCVDLFVRDGISQLGKGPTLTEAEIRQTDTYPEE